jgi:hypothetical protein
VWSFLKILLFLLLLKSLDAILTSNSPEKLGAAPQISSERGHTGQLGAQLRLELVPNEIQRTCWL